LDGSGKSEGRARGPIHIAMSSERGNPPAATVIQDAMRSRAAFLPKKQDRRVVSDAPSGNGSNICAIAPTKRIFSDLGSRAE